MTTDEAAKLFEGIGVVLFNRGDTGLSGGFNNLPEIIHGDVLPYIPGKIN